MLNITYSSTVFGLDAHVIAIETDINNGLPGIDMVGLLSSEIKEARERVKIAIKNSGYDFPNKKITINMSPADIKKTGTQFDLGIAIGILLNEEIVNPFNNTEICFFGELQFNGDISSVKGLISMVIEAARNNFKKVIIPYSNYMEAKIIEDIEIIPVRNLSDVVLYLNKHICVEKPEIINEGKSNEKLDFADVKGQFIAKRAAEICAAGMHNLLMSGPPGVGKSMIAKRIPSIMPDLSYEEKIELTRIYSAAGKLKAGHLISERPFRDPHNTITNTSLIGGGSYPIPGEISFANYGILFMDELPEFKRENIEVLRQPLEEGKIVINRINGSVEYPAEFTLVAAMNKCPCGFYPDRKKCKCSDGEISRYLNKISQPILDRIDIKVDLPSIKYSDLNPNIKSESSASIKKRVLRARAMQDKRFEGTSLRYNSRLSGKQVEQYIKISQSCKELIEDKFKREEFSARGFYRTLKVARTIADLDGSENVLDKHVKEALLFRFMSVRGPMYE